MGFADTMNTSPAANDQGTTSQAMRQDCKSWRKQRSTVRFMSPRDDVGATPVILQHHDCLINKTQTMTIPTDMLKCGNGNISQGPISKQ